MDSPVSTTSGNRQSRGVWKLCKSYRPDTVSSFWLELSLKNCAVSTKRCWILKCYLTSYSLHCIV